MFLSYAVVPVFTFTVLLNFFYLYSPISSQTPPTSQEFPTCDDCVKSECFKDKQGTCGLAGDNITYFCFTCDQTAELPLYPSEKECQTVCSQDTTKECVCDGPCYSCVVSAGLDKTALNCTMPAQVAANNTCALIPYGTPPATETEETQA